MRALLRLSSSPNSQAILFGAVQRRVSFTALAPPDWAIGAASHSGWRTQGKLISSFSCAAQGDQHP